MDKTVRTFLIFGSNYSKNCKELLNYFQNNQTENFEFIRFKSRERLGDRKNDKTSVIFVPIDLLENNDETDELIGNSNVIIIISTNVDQYFTDCLLQRKNKNEANNLWPKYTQTAEIILNSIEKHKSLHFIVDNYFNYAFESIIDYITKNIQMDRNFLINKNILFELIKEELKEKNNQEIQSLFHHQKSNFFVSFRRITNNWIKNLTSSNLNKRLEVIDEILAKYEHRHSMSPEEKSVLKNMIVNGKTSQGISVSSLLIQLSIDMLQHLKIEHHHQENIIDSINEQLESKNEHLQRIISILDIFHSICMHNIFSHEIFNDLNFLKLINQLFHSPFFILQMKATFLIRQMLDQDHKRYGSMISEAEKSKPANESFVQLIIKLIFKLCKPFLANDENDLTEVLSDYANFIDDNLFISGLELLLKGSFTNCKHVQINDLKELTNHAVKSIFRIHSIRIFSVLNNLLKYGSFTDWNKYVDVAQLLQRANTEIINLSLNRTNSILWKRVTEFYKNLLVMLENNDAHSGEEEGEDLTLNEEIDLNQTEIEVTKSFIINTKKFNKNLVDSFFNFKVKLSEKVKNQPFQILKSQEELASVCIENKEIQLENHELKDTLEKSESKVQSMKSEIERLERDKNIRIEECSKLRALIVKNSQFLEEKKANNKPDNKIEIKLTDQDDLFLKQVEEAKIELNHQVAKNFIQILGKKRENLTEFRKLICGSLKNLSQNLYTSPTHFLSEIIQNQEDNNYDQSEKPWFMKLIIHSKYLMFCSNENGFKVSDILAICSLSESYKKKGQQIGHKGLGFKSVFVCSDQPMIVSKPWQFQFNKNSNNDELAYITPYYLDSAEFPPDLSTNISENKNCNTFIYLPLKENYTKLNNNDILANFNHLVLLFTKNIEQIIIQDKINDTVTEIICTKKQDKQWKNIEFLKSIFNTIETFNCSINIKKRNFSNEIENINLSFYSCECTLTIPDDLIKDEDLNTNETVLTLAFQYEGSNGNSFPVFSFLPVYDIGFKFIINSYWSLTTNRESINEHAMINRFYRDHLSNFFDWLITNEPIIRNGIYNYLPRKRDLKLSNWWQPFIDDISAKIKPLLNSLITSNVNEKFLTRISNSKLDDLIDEKILNLIGINLIKPNNQLNEADLELYGFEKLTLKDVLFKCFNSNIEYGIEIKDWKKTRNSEWWEKLFRFYYIESLGVNNISNEIKDLEIFLAQTSEQDAKRVALNSNIKYFLSENNNFKYWWNSKLRLINSESLSEKNFILDVLKLPKISVEEIIEFIYLKHMTHSEHDQLHKTVWLDLEFIKNNFYRLKDGLCLPLKFDKKLLFPAKSCTISSLLGINLTELPLKKRFFFNDFNHFKSINQLSLKQILEWENFLIDLGCSLPLVDLDKLEKNENLLIFSDFNLFDNEDSQLACKIIEKIQDTNLLKTIQNLPIKSSLGNEQCLAKINNVCINNICLNMPFIKVSNYSIDLCRKLGVTVDINFDSCFKCLTTMVANQVNNSESYLEWLLKLNTFINGKTNYKSAFIRLKNVYNDEFDSFKADNIYLCDTTTSIFNICKYTKRTMINSNYNIAFKPLESLFISLGSHKKPQIDHLIETIDLISKDKNQFINNSFQNFLTNDAYHDLKELYMQLEECLVEKMNNKNFKQYNLVEREQLSTVKEIKDLLSENQIQLLKVITYDQHLLNFNEYSHEKVYCCFNSFILNTVKPKMKSNCIFIDSKLANECPLVMSFLKPNYLQSILKISLEHAVNNPEKTNHYLNRAFSQASNLNIEVLKCKYLNICYYLNEQHEIRNMIWNDIRFGIFNKSLVICAETDSFQGNLSVYVKALKTLLKSIYPSRDETSLDTEARNRILEIKDYLNHQNWIVSEHAYGSGSKFNLNDIMFSDDDFDTNQFNEIYSTSNESSSNKMDNKRKYINRNFLTDEHSYDLRVNKIEKILAINDTNLKNINTNNEVSVPLNYVNTDAQKRIGIKAEHFFCRFLKSKYGESFNEFECWVSSARNSVYPSTNASFDDRLGYDFKIKDYLNLFDCGRSRTTKLCFIEVKGTATSWDGTFHISQNELNKKYELKKDESYIIVIVEFVDNNEKINIARIINWTNDDQIIRIQPEQYLATYTPNIGLVNNNTSRNQANFDKSYFRNNNNNRRN